MPKNTNNLHLSLWVACFTLRYNLGWQVLYTQHSGPSQERRGDLRLCFAWFGKVH